MTEMTGIERLRAWSDENLLAGFEVLARHPPTGAPIVPRHFGTVVAFATGRRFGFFNPVVILDPPGSSEIEAAVDWVRDLGMSVTLRVREDLDGGAIQAAAAAVGLERSAWAEPGMVLAPIANPPPAPPGVRTEMATAATLDRWYRAYAAGTGLPDSPEDLVRNLIPEDVVDDPDVRLFGGFLEDTPVACSLALRSENVVGIYAVGTAEMARRRGIGSSIAWAAVNAGRAWGCRAAILQASEMGEPVYRAMGFRTVTRYVTYEAPPGRQRRPAPRADQASGSLSMSRVVPNRTASERSAGPSTRSSSSRVEASATDT